MTVEHCCEACRVLLPQLSPVLIDGVCRADGTVTIAAHSHSRAARCGRCGRVSTRVHGHYRRRVADLPIAGQPVVLWLTGRRFLCDRVDCSTVTFAEQVPGLTDPHARRSTGPRQVLAPIALALTGRPRSRLATRLGMAVGRSTLPYNSGAVEGTVNRIKRIKAGMYGRANSDLLRKLVLLR